MSDLHRLLVLSCAREAGPTHLRLVPQSEIDEVEDELARIRAELEPLQRAEAALLKRREALYRGTAA